MYCMFEEDRAATTGNMPKNDMVMFGRIFDLCERKDRQTVTDSQTYSSQYFAPLPDTRVTFLAFSTLAFYLCRIFPFAHFQLPRQCVSHLDHTVELSMPVHGLGSWEG